MKDNNGRFDRGCVKTLHLVFCRANSGRTRVKRFVEALRTLRSRTPWGQA
jgi:hypothetical protein